VSVDVVDDKGVDVVAVSANIERRDFNRALSALSKATGLAVKQGRPIA
jgi:hypothetical protein